MEITADRLQPGERGLVAGLSCRGGLRRRLIDLGLTPGAEIRLHRTAPFGDPLELHLRGYALSLRRDEARGIRVVPLGAAARPMERS